MKETSEIIHVPVYIKFRHQHSSSVVIDFRVVAHLLGGRRMRRNTEVLLGF